MPIQALNYRRNFSDCLLCFTDQRSQGLIIGNGLGKLLRVLSSFVIWYNGDRDRWIKPDGNGGYGNIEIREIMTNSIFREVI